MTNRQTKSNLSKCQNAVLVAKSAYETIKSQVKAIETKILADNEFYTDSNERITKASATFRMNDTDFADFLDLRYAEIVKSGLPCNPPAGIAPKDYVIEEPFRVALRLAEDNLLNFAKTIVPSDVKYLFDTNDYNVKNELIELTLSLKL